MAWTSTPIFGIQKKNMTFPLVFVLFTISLKNSTFLLSSSAPNKGSKSCRMFALSYKRCPTWLRWGEVAEESRFAPWKIARWCWLLPRISRWVFVANFPPISVSYLVAVKLPSTCSTPKNQASSSYPRWILYHSGKLTGQMKHPQFQ